MPNHWETSARPLFIKTVFVNGNRHAVLFEKDPLLNYRNYSFKRVSRSNSSLSFASNLSITSCESHDDTNAESKTSKFKNIEQRQRKDLSSDLQSCLVKLKLASNSLENKSKPGDEKCVCNKKEIRRSQSTDLKQKKHKWIHEKTCKREHNERFHEEPKEYKLKGSKNRKSNSCYVYNLENSRREKNYCIVKISSQPPQVILNCSCENNGNEAHKCNRSNKNNFVISATIHNIVMSSKGSENLLNNALNYVFENSELHWNNYLSRSYCNSLSERVLQWLDLTRERKKKETLNLASNDDVSNNIERIFSGKTFTNEIKKTDSSCKSDSKIFTNKKVGRIFQSETFHEEVSGEPHIETAVYAERLGLENLNSLNKFDGGSEHYNLHNNIIKKVSVPIDSNHSIKELSTPISNLIKSPLKSPDLFLNYGSKESYLFRDRTKIKEIRDVSARRKKQKEKENNEEDDSIKIIRRWEKKIWEKSSHANKSDSYSSQAQCHCNRNLDEYSDNIKSHILTGEFAEKNQKSINNLNITQTRPLLIQNLLSPQQQSKISYLQEEKIVWASEKNTGRPQLHIFLPTIWLRDQSDDSMSECENFLNT